MNVRLPDGRIIKNLPEGTTQEELIDRLRKAGIVYPGQEEAEHGFMAGVKGSAKQMLSSSRTALGSVTGDPNEAVKAGLARQQAIADQYPDELSLDKIKQTYNDEGLLAATKEVGGQAKTAIGQMLPQMGAVAAGARLGALGGAAVTPEFAGAGAAPGAILGGLAGAFAPSLIQRFGGNLETQGAVQQQQGEPIHVSRRNAAAGAVPGAVLDTAASLLPMGKTLTGKLFGSEVEKLLASGSERGAEKLAQERLLTTIAKGTGYNAAEQGMIQPLQVAINRAQAGQSLTDDEAKMAYANAALMAGLVSPMGIVGRATDKGAARERIALRDAPRDEAPPETPAPEAPPSRAPTAPVGTPTEVSPLKQAAHGIIDMIPPGTSLNPANLRKALKSAGVEADYASVKALHAELVADGKIVKENGKWVTPPENSNDPAANNPAVGAGTETPPPAVSPEGRGPEEAGTPRVDDVVRASDEPNVGERAGDQTLTTPEGPYPTGAPTTDENGTRTIPLSPEPTPTSEPFFREPPRPEPTSTPEELAPKNPASANAIDALERGRAGEALYHLMQEAGGKLSEDKPNPIRRLAERLFHISEDVPSKETDPLVLESIRKEELDKLKQNRVKEVPDAAIEAFREKYTKDEHVPDVNDLEDMTPKEAKIGRGKIAEMERAQEEFIEKYKRENSPGLTEADHASVDKYIEELRNNPSHPGWGESGGRMYRENRLVNLPKNSKIEFDPRTEEPIFKSFPKNKGPQHISRKSFRSAKVNVEGVKGHDQTTIERLKKEGSLANYDPKTNTFNFTRAGLNDKTMLHEMVHATTVRVLHDFKFAPENLTPEQKEGAAQIHKIYAYARDHVAAKLGEKNKGVMHPAFKNVYEFVAYGTTNDAFQRVLASINFPHEKGVVDPISHYSKEIRSDLWSRFTNALVKMFSVKGGRNALIELSEAVDSIYTLPETEELRSRLIPGLTQEIGKAQRLNAVGAVATDIGDFIHDQLPKPGQKILDGARNALSRVPDATRRAVYGFMSMHQLKYMFEKELPSIKTLEDTVGIRGKDLMDRRDGISKNLREWFKVANKYKKLLPEFYDIANRTTLDQINVFDKTAIGIDGKPSYDPNNALTKRFNRLPLPLQQVYKELVGSYRKNSEEMIGHIGAHLSTTKMQALKAEFQSKQMSVYLPLFRKGDDWLTYQDKNNETVTAAFTSPRERDKAILAAKKSGAQDRTIRSYSRMTDIPYKTQPPTGFLGDLLRDLDQAKVDQGTKDMLKDALYSTYMDYLPSGSIRQMYRTREGVQGFEKDVFHAYANVASKAANNLSNMKYAKHIEAAMTALRTDAENTPTQPVMDALRNLDMQTKFILNPHNSNLVQRTSYFTYIWYLAGNVSSAITNATQVPMSVYPLIGGKYGFAKAGHALAKAYSMYANGGKEDHTGFMPDWTFSQGKNISLAHRALFDAALARGAIKLSPGHEYAMMRNTMTADYNGLRAKIEHGMGWIFSNSERMNREVTLLAAFDLARDSGMSVEKAIDEAISISADAHGAALAETGPRFFQQGLGKVAFTFKRFAQSQIYLVAKMFNQAFRDTDPAVRSVARKQLLGIFGVTYAFAGAQGLPLYGAANMLASLIMGDDDKPYDFDQEVINSIGMTGFKGPVNQLIGVDVASRTGFDGLVWRDDPKRLSEVGPLSYALEQAAGPTYGLMRSMSDGYKEFQNGNYERSLEKMMPAFIRNGLKGYRFMTEGAMSRSGAPIKEDISGYNNFMMLMGFNPTEVAEESRLGGAMKQEDKLLSKRRASLFDQYYAATIHGDEDEIDAVRSSIYRFSELNPDYKISGDNLTSSVHTREKRIAESVHGVYIPSKHLNQIREEYPD
jgi:hypothetical protein